MKFEKFIFWMNLLDCGFRVFVPMSILGLLLGNMFPAKFLIFGTHPVLLMGFIGSVGLIICVIGKIIVTILNKRDKEN